VVGRYGDGWRVRVAAPPERGRANAELVSYLAALVGVPRGAVRILAGRGSRDKLVEVRGVDPHALTAALASSSAG
jgi:uncharacterized protein YggU (UPF0235/DUF167 family)